MSVTDYTAAPACALLATRCCVCSRPLVDSRSVETGIGPICAEKFGYGGEGEGLSQEARSEANALVYKIAAQQTGVSVVVALVRLRELGFSRLAARIWERVAALATVVIEEAPLSPAARPGALPLLRVSAPYVEAATSDWRAIPGRRFDRETKANLVPSTQRAALWALLRAHYPGAVGVSPRGAFVISTKEGK